MLNINIYTFNTNIKYIFIIITLAVLMLSSLPPTVT